MQCLWNKTLLAVLRCRGRKGFKPHLSTSQAPAALLLWERAFNTLHTHCAAGYTSTNELTLPAPSRLFNTGLKMGLIAFLSKLSIYQYNPEHHQQGLDLVLHTVSQTESAARSSWDTGITQAKQQGIWIILHYKNRINFIQNQSTNPILGKLSRLEIFGL